MMISRPQNGEYGSFYAGYINRVPEGSDLFALLTAQPDELRALLSKISDEQASIRPAPSEWSVKEVVGHICDSERIFAYRALRIARGDATPLAGFDQDEYVSGTKFNTRSLSGLLEEFDLQRRANLICLQPLTEIELLRRGTASDAPVSARPALHSRRARHAPCRKPEGRLQGRDVRQECIQIKSHKCHLTIKFGRGFSSPRR